MRGSLDAIQTLAVLGKRFGASVATSVLTSSISLPASMLGAAMVKAEECLARIELVWRLSRDGVVALSDRPSSSEVELSASVPVLTERDVS
jgi:hypothetical protein